MAYRCLLCPHSCVISNGGSGICGVRSASADRLVLPYYGAISAASLDPIEKKPLYHFHPSEMIFSIGFYGCNLSCPFCQNHRISKDFKSFFSGEKTEPRQVVEAALEQGSFGIAYTYSEPIVHFEYVLKTAAEARKHGLKNVLVTNGFIENEKGKELLELMDAANIDLKSFSDAFYKNELKGSLEPVLNFISNASGRVHTEVTTLLISGKNDSIDEISASARFIGGLNRNIPFHLSAYYPAYKYRVPATSPASVTAAAGVASKHLNFVFTGNISSGISDTHCPSCGKTLISRSGYRTRLNGLRDGVCTGCGENAAGFGIIL